jgi:hypothetical protein
MRLIDRLKPEFDQRQVRKRITLTIQHLVARSV